MTGEGTAHVLAELSILGQTCLHALLVMPSLAPTASAAMVSLGYHSSLQGFSLGCKTIMLGALGWEGSILTGRAVLTLCLDSAVWVLMYLCFPPPLTPFSWLEAQR